MRRQTLTAQMRFEEYGPKWMQESATKCLMERNGKQESVLFSYVVDHDFGFAPNPYNGYCTLVHCKFGGKTGRRNIVELAVKGDWILGTGGQGKCSAGNGRIIYLMRVDEKLPFRKYLSDKRFEGRSDCRDFDYGNACALVSKTFFYFGCKAVPVSGLPEDLANNLVKKYRGFRRDYPSRNLVELREWVKDQFKKQFEDEGGMGGDPCCPERETLNKQRKITDCPHCKCCNVICCAGSSN